MAQTPDGYIWIATNNGLVRFDGVRFKVYQKNSNPELTSDRIVHIKVDDGGRLWIFPEASPKFVLYENGSFRSFPRGPGYESNWVPESSSEGRSTIFTSNGTEFVYSDGDMISRPATARPRECSIDREGTVWIDDGDNFYAINGTDTLGTTYSDSTGHFLLRGIPAGSYALHFVPNSNFQFVEKEGVNVQVGVVTDVETVLIPEN